MYCRKCDTHFNSGEHDGECPKCGASLVSPTPEVKPSRARVIRTRPEPPVDTTEVLEKMTQFPTTEDYDKKEEDVYATTSSKENTN